MVGTLPRTAVEARSWADLLRAARVLVESQPNLPAKREIVVFDAGPYQANRDTAHLSEIALPGESGKAEDDGPSGGPAGPAQAEAAPGPPATASPTTPTQRALPRRIAQDLCAVGLTVIVASPTTSPDGVRYQMIGSEGSSDVNRPGGEDKEVGMPSDPIEWASAIVCVYGDDDGSGRVCTETLRTVTGGGAAGAATGVAPIGETDKESAAAAAAAASGEHPFEAAVSEATRRATEGTALLIPVWGCAACPEVVAPALRPLFFWDLHAADDYHHNMIRRGAVPGVLTMLTGLNRHPRFHLHCVKYTLRTVPSRLPNRNEDFVPREALASLRSLLDHSPVALTSPSFTPPHPPRDGAPRPGPPIAGVGKTAAAIEYAYASREKKSYAVIRWFDCTNGSVELQVRSFASELDLSSGLDVSAETLNLMIHAVLAELGVSYLLIFDGVADLRQVKPFLPPSAESIVSPGQRSPLKHILITTAVDKNFPVERHATSEWCAELVVPPLTEGEFDDLILADLPMLPPDDVQRLRKLVSSIAAGASMAAALLWHDEDGIDELLSKLAGVASSSLATHQIQALHAELWHRCLLGAESARRGTRLVYEMLCYVEQGAAPIWLLKDLLGSTAVQAAFGVERACPLPEVFAALRTYRLCRVPPEPLDDEWIRLHTFGQAIVKKQDREADSQPGTMPISLQRATAMLEALTGAVVALLPSVPHDGRKGHDTLARVRLCTAANALVGNLNCFDEGGRCVDEAHRAAAEALFRLGMPQQAAAELVQLQGGAKRDQAVEVSTAMIFARIWLHAGQPEAAVECLGPAVATPRGSASSVDRASDLRIGPCSSPPECLILMGSAMEMCGRLREALAYAREGCQLLQDEPFDSAGRTLQEGLALAVRLAASTGSLDTQHACLVDLWQLHESSAHPDASVMLKTARSLGLVSGRLGLYGMAVESFTSAVEMASVLHSAVDVDRLHSHLAEAYGALGMHLERRQLLQRVLESQVRRWGKNHRDVGATLARLGMASGDEGDYLQAAKLLENALRLQKEHLGSNHAEVLVTLTNLGAVYGKLGRRDAALAALLQAVKVKTALFGQHSLDAVTAMANLGRLFLLNGDRARALEVLLPAYATRRRYITSPLSSSQADHDDEDGMLATTHLAQLVCFASMQMAREKWASGEVTAALEHVRRATVIVSDHSFDGGEVRAALSALEQQLLLREGPLTMVKSDPLQ